MITHIQHWAEKRLVNPISLSHQKLSSHIQWENKTFESFHVYSTLILNLAEHLLAAGKGYWSCKLLAVSMQKSGSTVNILSYFIELCHWKVFLVSHSNKADWKVIEQGSLSPNHGQLTQTVPWWKAFGSSHTYGCIGWLRKWHLLLSNGPFAPTLEQMVVHSFSVKALNCYLIKKQMHVLWCFCNRWYFLQREIELLI